MVEMIQVEDPAVSVDDIKRLKLAFLMQFFVQHKRRFRFPRLRLQDLYQQVLLGTDTVLLSDCVARILRFLRQRDPTVCIATADKALDAFVAEKRDQSHRDALQAARDGLALAELKPASRALLLEHLIECVYDERPELSFNAVLNATSSKATSNQSEDTLFGPEPAADDDSLIIKAGQDSSGSSYYYMDDLRLYRETPQSGLSSHWSVAVGAATQQWTSFIASLGRVGEEAELAHFLRSELFTFVRDCIENIYLNNDHNEEITTASLLDKEATELAEIRRLRGLPPIPPPAPSSSSNTSIQPPPNAATELLSGSAGSSSGNSTSTCPLTPPNGTPSAAVGSGTTAVPPTGHCANTPENTEHTIKKEPSTSPNTPANAWSADGQIPPSGQATTAGLIGARCQHPNSVGATTVNTDTTSVISPCTGDAYPPRSQPPQATNDSPLRRPASGPIPSTLHTDPHATSGNGQPRSAPPPFPVADPSATNHIAANAYESQRRISNPLAAQGYATTEVGGPDVLMPKLEDPSSYRPEHQQQHASHPQALTVGPTPPLPQMFPSRAMVFTTDLANEAALNFGRSRMRITAFHSMHPAVRAFMLQNGASMCAGVDPTGVTQEQLENRKTKIARLEKIKSKLAKSKMTPAATMATMQQQQQQQFYAAAAAMTAGQPMPLGPPPPPPPGHPSQPQAPPLPQGMPPTGHPGPIISRNGPLPMEMQPTGLHLPRGTMMTGDRDSDRAAWLQAQQHKAMDSFSYGGGGGVPPSSMDHGSNGGPPVLIVPPNNACVYNPTPPPPSGAPPPPPNRFCFSPPPPYKRPYPPDMAAHEQQFWDQQQVVFEQQQQQQAMMMQQQQQQQMVVVSPTLPPTGGRGGNGVRTGGLNKKRKTTAAANRAAAAAAAPNRPLAMSSSFGGPQRIPPGGLPGGTKAGGFGSVPIGPPRGPGATTPYPQHSILPGADPFGVGYPNPTCRGMPSGPHMMDPHQHPQQQHLYATGGPLVSALSVQQGQQPPLPFQQACCDTTVSPKTSAVTSSSSGAAVTTTTSTQHLTSASLASLARLSQLSGAEGPFSASATCPPTSLASVGAPFGSGAGGYSRMGSAPDMFAAGGGGMIPPGLDGDPASLYPGAYHHVNPQISSQFVAHQQQQQQPHPPVSLSAGFPPVSATQRCLTPNSAPPGLPTTLVSPLSGLGQQPPGGPASSTNGAQQPQPAPVPPPSNPPQQQAPMAASQPPPSIQVNNTFFNAQLNVQQMNYQHVNGGPGVGGAGCSAQMQIHFIQQQQQHQQHSQQQRNPSGQQHYFGSSAASTNGVVNSPQQHPVSSQQPPAPAAPLNQKMGAPPANVQITPKTPHTIQYLPSTTGAAVSAAPTTTSSSGGGSGPKQAPTSTSSVTSVPRMQTTTPNAMLADRQQPPSTQRLQKMDQTQQQQTHMTTAPTTTSALGTGQPSQGGISSGGTVIGLSVASNDMLPHVEGVYGGMPVPKGPAPGPAFAMAAVEQIQPSDNSPFDFPQGATTTYLPRVNPPVSSSGRPDSMQYSSSPYMSASSEFASSSKMAYMNEMSFQHHQHHQRWQHQQHQQQQQMSLSAAGGDFYMQQQMMMSAGHQQPQQQQQQYYVSQQQNHQQQVPHHQPSLPPQHATAAQQHQHARHAPPPTSYPALL